MEYVRKTAVCIQACGAQTKSMTRIFLFRFLMSYDHHYHNIQIRKKLI